MYSKELNELIDTVLADGQITDKERAVVRKRAMREGVDEDEIDVYIDGLLHQRKQAPHAQNARQADSQEGRCKSGYKKYLAVVLLCAVAVVAANIFISSDTTEEQIIDHVLQRDKYEILGLFKDNAYIATTTVSIRRMGIIDPDAEEILIYKPGTWKIGYRGCVVPVDITLEYGIDLEEMDDSNIVLEDNDVVKITLPKAKIIPSGSGYRAETNQTDIVRISTGFRDPIGAQTIQRVKKKAYDEVLTDTLLLPQLENEVTANTKTVFEAMLKGMGMKPIFN